jgi:iron complex outermembrane receptor protein
MTKKIFLILIFLLTLSFKTYADIPEILIKPKNEEYTRLSSGLSGSNITIISKEDLASQHGKNLPQILETYSGIDVRRLYDGVGGTNSSLDIRGFGEASKSNSLILVNGIRLNDIDMSNVNLSYIPIGSIERIEIIRGGSAGTLYGSGVIGGAVNIVTKNENLKNRGELSISSYNKLGAEFSLSNSFGEKGVFSLSGTGFTSDTFRDAGDYSDENFVLNIKNTIDQTKFNLDIFSSYREQDLPGPRVKGGAVYNYHFCNRYEDSKTAKHIGGSFAENGDTCNTDQRDDYSNLENERLNLGMVHEIDSLKTIFLNIGYKKKNNKAFLAANGNTKDTPNNGDRYLNTSIDGNIYNGRYEIRRKEDEQVGQNYDADLKVQSMYFQNTLYFNETDTSLSFGIRSEKSEFGARDEVNRSVSGFINSWDATDHDTFDNSSTNQALNIGVEKIIDRNFSIYGNYSESFRIPNIDERILATTSGSFALKDQESDGIEIGIIYSNEVINLNINYFNIDTLNEIQYDQSVNTNLDPIKREGINLEFELQPDNKNKFIGSMGYVNAEFTGGSLSMGTGSYEFLGTRYYNNNETYGYLTNTAINYLGSDGTANQSFNLAGRKVPLVSPLTYSLNYIRYLNNATNFNLGINYFDKKYVSNDQENIEPQIPDYYIVNSSISSISGPYTLSFGINNLFDEQVYDFAVSSTFHDDAHYGLSNVYPLPDRNAFFNFEYTF